MCPNVFQHINARFCCSRKEITKERKRLNAKRTASAAPYKPKKIPVARTVSKSTRHMIYAFFRSFPPRNLIEVLLFRVSLRERSRHRIGRISPLKHSLKHTLKTNTMSTEQPQSDRLYVGNIPWSTTVEELQGLFTDAENIEIPTVRFFFLIII